MSSSPWQLALKMFQEMLAVEVEVDVKLDPKKNNQALGGGFKYLLGSSLPGNMIQFDSYFSFGLNLSCRSKLDRDCYITHLERIKHCKCRVTLREFPYKSAWFGSVIHHDPSSKGCKFLPYLHEWLKTINCSVILGKLPKNVFVM